MDYLGKGTLALTNVDLTKFVLKLSEKQSFSVHRKSLRSSTPTPEKLEQKPKCLYFCSESVLSHVDSVCQSVGAEPVWFSDGGRSETDESGGGVGGFEGGCISLWGLLTCRGLHLCAGCLLMLLLFGFRGRLFLSSLAAGWSLRASEDSSMYARFSPKKSSSWQLAEEAMLSGAEGRRTGW